MTMNVDAKITNHSAEIEPLWKEGFAQARSDMTNWWNRKGLAISVTAAKETPSELFEKQLPATDLETQWLDPAYRTKREIYRIANTYYGGVAMPQMSVDIGPGSLGLFLGGGGKFAPDTVWFEPVIQNPDEIDSLTIDFDGDWWKQHVAIIQEAKRFSPGRYLVGFPDLIENIDTLAQLREPQTLLMDLLERPQWVIDRIQDINRAYFEAYDALIHECGLLDDWGGTTHGCFYLWGVGKTAKVQCDLSCMISPSMFRRFVTPALSEQCAWLDNSVYHLDGIQALPQLDNILAIDEIDAIQWTPGEGRPGPGSPTWYDLYRRIRAGGKSVQAFGVNSSEVEPLIDAVGPEGLMVVTWTTYEAEARELLDRVYSR